MNESHRELIRAGIKEAKARGVLIGAANPLCRNLTVEMMERGRARGAESVHRGAVEAYESLLPMLEQIRNEGKSYREVAHEMNERGLRTRRGVEWSGALVWRVLNKIKGK